MARKRYSSEHILGFGHKILDVQGGNCGQEPAISGKCLTIF